MSANACCGEAAPAPTASAVPGRPVALAVGVAGGVLAGGVRAGVDGGAARPPAGRHPPPPSALLQMVPSPATSQSGPPASELGAIARTPWSANTLCVAMGQCAPPSVLVKSPRRVPR